MGWRTNLYAGGVRMLGRTGVGIAPIDGERRTISRTHLHVHAWRIWVGSAQRREVAFEENRDIHGEGARQPSWAYSGYGS